MTRIDVFDNSIAARALGRWEKVQGEDADIGTSWREIWDVNAAYNFLASAATLYIGSDNAADTSIEVTVEGLDSDWKSQEITVTLDATDPQATQVAVVSSGGSETWIRVNRAYVSGATAATGNIYIADEDPGTWTAGGLPGTLGNTVAYISSANQETKQSVFTSPVSDSGYALWLEVTENSGQATDFRVRVRENGGSFVTKYTKVGVTSETFIIEWLASIVIPPRADVTVEAQAQATTADVSCELDVIRQ